MNEPDSSAPSAPLPQSPTSVFTRKWCVDRLKASQALLVRHRSLVTPEDEALATASHDAEGGSGGFPLWLVLGLAADHYVRELEERLRPLVETAMAEDSK